MKGENKMKLPSEKYHNEYGLQKLYIRLKGDFYPMNIYKNYDSLHELLNDLGIKRYSLAEYYYS